MALSLDLPSSIFLIQARNFDRFNKMPIQSKMPVLELNDGTCLSESMAICRYIEELHPEPNLLRNAFGTGPGGNVESANGARDHAASAGRFPAPLSVLGG